MKYSYQELNDFEQITFKNMVTFYRDEQERIANGEMSTVVLLKGDRRVLRRLGVLELHFTGHGGRLLQVSPRAREILKTW